MMTVYSRIYNNKFTSEVNYYFHLQSQGKPQFQVFYESLSDYDYYYSKYIIFLNFYPSNKSKIELEVLTNAPTLLSKIKTKRKLAVLTKFIFYALIRHNSFPVTKAISKVVYNNNGNEFQLSVNAFIKSYYNLLPSFKQIVSTPSPQV